MSDWNKHFDSAINEYIKRLGNMVIIETIKPSKNWTPKQIIEKDTEKIIEILKNKYWNAFKVLLSKNWEKIDTINLSKIYKWNSSVLFVIWWPYWFNETLLEHNVNKLISFWNITMPHWLVKLVLLEQIFRIDTIEKNKIYHY